ncbi:hypothetical protein [Aurantibacillus circumpalustris]|uniref:hypothetical protein n=1 Tax=Aurantibacillus circumpalustris TaxID=3036359 RepID=UPI00295B0CBC|nr:hypothetical protein [Aurantibacillus circumpalustris]
MKTYKNLSGTSGVVAYEIGKTYIKIKFDGESGIYTFDYKRPGKQLVEQMKLHAAKGQGLGSFISDKVGANFSSKK